MTGCEGNQKRTVTKPLRTEGRRNRWTERGRRGQWIESWKLYVVWREKYDCKPSEESAAPPKKHKHPHVTKKTSKVNIFKSAASVAHTRTACSLSSAADDFFLRKITTQSKNEREEKRWAGAPSMKNRSRTQLVHDFRPSSKHSTYSSSPLQHVSVINPNGINQAQSPSLTYMWNIFPFSLKIGKLSIVTFSLLHFSSSEFSNMWQHNHTLMSSDISFEQTETNTQLTIVHL